MSQMENIKNLREQTGAGVVEVKKALDEASGDMEKAREILRKKGQDKALKKGDRETHEGVVMAYVHSNRVGALVKLYCETDFVARNAEFQELAKDIAMHITAAAPSCLRPEDLDPHYIAKERSLWEEQLQAEGKTAEMREKIMAGKEAKLRQENALLTQAFVKNPDITIEALLTEKIHKMGENIQIGDFVRYEM
jgi:elongation factor Ts